MGQPVQVKIFSGDVPGQKAVTFKYRFYPLAATL